MVRATRRVGSIAAGVGLLVSSSAGLAACGGSGPSAAQVSTLLAAALRNAVAGQWVHEVLTATEPGHKISLNNEIGTSDGREMIDSDGAKSTTILVDHTVYFRGDLKTIVAYKFSPKHPTAIVGRWISIGATSKYYAGASASLTLASDFLKVNLLGPLTEGSDVAIDGIQAVPIYGQVKSSNGTQTAKATIYVTASGTTLPVEFHATTGAVDETINWSQWGRRVTIDAPHSAIPIAKLPS